MSLHQSLVRLQAVAQALEELLTRVVFVGGATVGLYSTRAAAPEVRFTEDVDCIIELASYGAYAQLEDKLREKGFRNMRESHVQVRWQLQSIIVDIMPTDPAILGFTNRWYSSGIISAVEYRLPDGQVIKILDAPHFIATKLEALRNRGEDLRWDADFEDVVFLLGQRPVLTQEIAAASPELVEYLKAEFRQLAAYGHIREAVEAAMDRGDNPKAILDSMEAIAAL